MRIATGKWSLGHMRTAEDQSSAHSDHGFRCLIIEYCAIYRLIQRAHIGLCGLADLPETIQLVYIKWSNMNKQTFICKRHCCIVFNSYVYILLHICRAMRNVLSGICGQRRPRSACNYPDETYFSMCAMKLNLCILNMFEDTFSFDVTHMLQSAPLIP